MPRTSAGRWGFPRCLCLSIWGHFIPGSVLVKRTFAVGVTTELRMMHLRDQAHLLPRLDMFYYREPGRLERWGTSAFRRHLWFRGELRRARNVLAGRL